MTTSSPVYQYVVVSDSSEIIQYDWKLFFRERIVLTCKGREILLPEYFIGKPVNEVLPKGAEREYEYYFMKPR